MSSATCAKCDAPLTDQTHVPLWDGRSYCRACVEDACPGLADYARGNVRLHERVPRVHFGESLGAHALRMGILTAALAFMFLSFARGIDLWEGIIFTACLTLVFYIPAALIGGAVGPGGPNAGASAVNGCVFFSTPSFLRRRGIRLSRCTWQMVDDMAFRPTRIVSGSADRKVILIRGPRFRAAVGWTPRRRGYWLGLLKLADVPYGDGRGQGWLARLEAKGRRHE